MARTKQTARRTGTNKTAQNKQPGTTARTAKGQNKQAEKLVEGAHTKWNIAKKAVEEGRLVYAGWDVPVWKAQSKSGTGSTFYIVNSAGSIRKLNNLSTSHNIPKTFHKVLTEVRKNLKDPGGGGSFLYPSIGFDPIQKAVADLCYLYAFTFEQTLIPDNTLSPEICMKIMALTFDSTPYSTISKFIPMTKKDKTDRLNDDAYEDKLLPLIVNNGGKLNEAPSYSYALRMVCTFNYLYDPLIFFPLTMMIGPANVAVLTMNPSSVLNVLKVLQTTAAKSKSMYIALWCFMIYVAICSPLYQHLLESTLVLRYKDATQQTEEIPYIPNLTLLDNYIKWAIAINREGWVFATAEFAGQADFIYRFRVDCDFNVPDVPAVTYPNN